MSRQPEDRQTSPENAHPRAGGGVSRRAFIQTVGVSAAAGAIRSGTERALARENQDGPAILGPQAVRATFRVNGQAMVAQIEPGTTLLEALRERLDLTGAKPVCERASCGACSVLVDGKLVASCMMLALDATEAQITTVEGLGAPDALDPIQAAFIKHDALQCGFCTPGLVVAARALLNETPKPTLTQIKKGLAGNICRCGTYTNVFNAVLDASGQAPIRDGKGA